VRKTVKWTPELIGLAMEMFRSGEHRSNIARAIGCSEYAVRKKLILEGMTEDKRCCPGKPVVLTIDVETWLSLHASASARGRSVGALMADLAKVLADPVLLENVLDDGVSL
jgi:hypothetical protein